MRDPSDDGNVLYFDFINVKFPAVKLYYSFARGDH